MSLLVAWWLRVTTLATTVHSLPHVDRYIDYDEAVGHVVAAMTVETDDTPAELLLAIAYTETRYRSHIVSAVKRKRDGVVVRFCGVTQAQAKTSRMRCRALRSPVESYRTTVNELARWRKVARGSFQKMLAGYGCGFPMSLKCGSHNGRKKPYPARVVRVLRMLEETHQTALGAAI